MEKFCAGLAHEYACEWIKLAEVAKLRREYL